jgi:hypothetical protein
MLWPTVSLPVYLDVKPHLGPKIRFLLLSYTCVLVEVGGPLWREDGSVFCNCCCSSPTQLFWGLSPAWFHILLSQIRDSANLEGQVSVYISPGNRVAQLYSRHWVHFSSPVRLAGQQRNYLNPPSHGPTDCNSSQSQSYVTTDGQLTRLSSCQDPPWAQDQIWPSHVDSE